VPDAGSLSFLPMEKRRMSRARKEPKALVGIRLKPEIIARIDASTEHHKATRADVIRGLLPWAIDRLMREVTPPPGRRKRE